MKKTSAFFNLFPPPKFLEMPYAGIDISDSSVHCLMYHHMRAGLVIDRFGSRDIAKGVIENGIIKDSKALAEIIRSLASELKVTYVKASLPEERMYLFKTVVPDGTASEIHENLALRLEENVPLPSGDAVFYFDLIRDAAAQGKRVASVSAAPRSFVESYLSVLEDAGLVPVSFEVTAKSLARAIIPIADTDTKLIIHLMKEKVGLYIVDEGVVLFTSTVPWAPAGELALSDIESLEREIKKVYAYWGEHGQGAGVNEIMICGHSAAAIAGLLGRGTAVMPQLTIADVWVNTFSFDRYVPPITRDDSLEYAVAAGLAQPGRAS